MLGRGYQYATALEWALKLKEVAGVFADPYSSADYEHGPISLAESGTPVLAVVSSGPAMAGHIELLGRLAVIGAELLIVSDAAEARDIATGSLTLPADIPEWLAPIVAILPCQLLAYHLAIARGRDPEAPRNLHKVTLTTVAHGPAFANSGEWAHRGAIGREASGPSGSLQRGVPTRSPRPSRRANGESDPSVVHRRSAPMADFGLFIGWGDIRSGRQAASNTVFAEALAYWPRLQAAGEIESFETVILGYHGGDLDGFFLLRGDPEKLGRLGMSPEFQRLTARASAVVEGMGVINAMLDARAVGWVGEANQAVADIV